MADFLKAEEVLESLDIKNSMMGAEFGCGSAVFALALAKKMPTGRVYAIDIQEEKLSALKGRSLIERVTNIITVHADLEAIKGSGLQDNFLDIVLIPNILFQVENKSAIINEAKRILKIEGQMLIIDWLNKNAFSPKEGMIHPDKIKEVAEDLGFSLKKEFAVGDYHYGLLFIKK